MGKFFMYSGSRALPSTCALKESAAMMTAAAQVKGVATVSIVPVGVK